MQVRRQGFQPCALAELSWWSAYVLAVTLAMALVRPMSRVAVTLQAGAVPKASLYFADGDQMRCTTMKCVNKSELLFKWS
jgi:hypothetical protein